MSNKVKIWDIVRIAKDSPYIGFNEEVDPADTDGIVTETEYPNDNYPVLVVWANGEDNVYRHEDLVVQSPEESQPEEPLAILSISGGETNRDGGTFYVKVVLNKELTADQATAFAIAGLIAVSKGFTTEDLGVEYEFEEQSNN